MSMFIFTECQRAFLLMLLVFVIVLPGRLCLANIPSPERAQTPDAIYSAGLAALGKGDYAEAAKFAEELGRKEGDSSRKIELESTVFFETGEYGRALKLLAGKDLPDLVVLRAKAEAAVGKFAIAAKMLNTRLAGNPDDFKAIKLLLEINGTLGRRGEIVRWRRHLEHLPHSKMRSPNALMALAEAVKRRDPKSALQLIEKAIKLLPGDAELLVAAGELCMDNFAWNQAERNFKSALAINSKNTDALTGLAWLALYHGDVVSAERSARSALDVNPNKVEALSVLAVARIVVSAPRDAEQFLDKAGKVNPKDPDIIALRAALSDTLGDAKGRDEWIAKAKEINSASPLVFNTLADLAQTRNRPAEAVGWAEKAIETAPYHWRGHYIAGTSLVRLGEEKRGYAELAKSFDLNPFNIFAYNILQVLDRDFVKHQFAKLETEHFVVKIPKEDVDALWPEMSALLESSYRRLTRKYGFIPKGPEEYGGKILIEVMPDHESFSARTIGLPGICASGVCFGQVVLMPSPRQSCLGNGPGIDWRSIVEHEFTHVITVQMSGYAITRWLTEGLSSWEESDTHKTWASAMVEAMANGAKAPSLETFDAGFLRPTYLAQVPVSYFQSDLACAHISKKYGFKAIIDMIRLCAKHAEHAEFAALATGRTVKELDAELAEVYSSVADRRKKRVDEARKTLKTLTIEAGLGKKKKKETSATVSPSWKPLVDKLMENGDLEKEKKALEALLAINDNDYHLHKTLGIVEMKLGDNAKAAERFREAMYRNPFDEELRGLAAKAKKKAGKE